MIQPRSLPMAKARYNYQMALARQLAGQQQQVRSPMQGIANMANSFASAYLQGRALRSYEDAQQAAADRQAQSMSKAFQMLMPREIPATPGWRDPDEQMGAPSATSPTGYATLSPDTGPVPRPVPRALAHLVPYREYSADAFDEAPVRKVLPDIAPTPARTVAPGKAEMFAASQILMQDSPQLAGTLLSQALKPPTTYKLGAGETVFDAAGNIIAEGRDKPESTQGKILADLKGAVEANDPVAIKFLTEALIDPKTLNQLINPITGVPNEAYIRMKERIARAGAGRTSVSVDTRERMRPVDKAAAKWYASATDADKGAARLKNIADTQRLINMLRDNPEAFENAAFKRNVGEFLASIGQSQLRDRIFDSNNNIMRQEYYSTLLSLVLQKQLLQKGPQTESDAKRLEQSLGSLTNKPEANLVILRAQQAGNVLDEYRNDFAGRYLERDLDGDGQPDYNQRGIANAWNQEIDGARLYIERRFADTDNDGVADLDANGNRIIDHNKGTVREYVFFNEYIDKFRFGEKYKDPDTGKARPVSYWVNEWKAAVEKHLAEGGR